MERDGKRDLVFLLLNNVKLNEKEGVKGEVGQGRERGGETWTLKLEENKV